MKLKDNYAPIYLQIKNMILNDIKEGKLAPGHKVLSERDLAEMFNTSRMTARHALLELENEGIIERRLGLGSFISSNKIIRDFMTFESFTKTMLGKGLNPQTRVLSIAKESGTSELGNHLNRTLPFEIFKIKRLRLADKSPIAIEVSHIPCEYCPDIDEYLTDNMSLYELLENKYGIKLVKAHQYFQVVLAANEHSKILSISSNSPCLFFEAIAYNAEGQAIEFSTSITRADNTKFYAELKL